MKRIGKLCFCLAGGLVLNTGLRAVDSASLDNPYAPIVTRNVFNINPPPPVDPNAQPVDPPPKITPNGIMGVYGHLQVLYKVALPPKDGHPGKDQSYVLSEGQAEDEIEVTKIDNVAGIVTFNNHGTVQALPLVVGAASGPSSAPAQSKPGPNLNFSRFPPVSGSGGNAGGPMPAGNRFGQSGSFGGQNPNLNAMSANNGNMSGSATSGSKMGVALAGGGGFSSQPGAASSSGGNSPSQFSPSPYSPEEIQALIANQHAQALKAGDISAPIFPETIFDSAAGIPGPSPTPPSGPASH